MIKTFVIDFSESKRITNILTKSGCSVESEKTDGARAYKLIVELMPDLIFVNYKNKPSHGRQTAISVKQRKKTTQIPIYFVDGKQIENQKIKELGESIKFDEIENIVKLKRKLADKKI
ncbi:MAG: hypothetical protein CR986_04370 [Ignavibacteriae bacterium]|nr:MAG: hypothetical protein CR986_04370 [Ignavibacteriota bacterium]